MSKYRHEIRAGVLVRTKRSLLRFWNWSFNRSEEDYVNFARNRLAKINDDRRVAIRKLKALESEYTKRFNDVKAMDGITHSFPDAWTRRRDPIKLVEQRPGPVKKKEKVHPPPPAEIARLVVPTRR